MAGLVSSARLLAGIAVVSVSAALVAGAAAQTAAVPDFSSNGAAWAQGNGVNFIAVPGSPSPIVNDPAHPHYSNQEARRLGIEPTYRIADLTNPNLKQWAKDVMKKDNDEVLKGKIAYTPGSSCKPAGTPVFMLDGGPFYFVQTPKEVLIVASEDSNARHVYMNVPHSANPKPSWYGESVGHYENGDTLVVDTIGLTTKTFVDQFRTPHTDRLHVVERWHLLNGGKNLEIEVTIDDPGTFNQPWKGLVRLKRGDEPYTEFVCSEGNHNLFDYGIPKADKADF